MNWLRIPLGNWVVAFVDWMERYLGGFFSFLSTILRGAYEGVDFVLATLSFWIMLILFVVLAWYVSGWRLGIGAAIGLFLISSLVATLIGIPLGIWAARSKTASDVIRPILDFLQTMPAFVYLIPALMFFGVGVVPGIVATIVFALAPGVRLTELGIRGVDPEVVEAGYAFGATPGRVLRQIQLPLALPSIMAGINQVITLSLSMVVIAGMVGAGGLGQQVVDALNRIDVGLGFEAGLSVVILAMLLDRFTSALGPKNGANAKEEKNEEN